MAAEQTPQIPPTDDKAMEDILSSIRDTVEEETQKDTPPEGATAEAPSEAKADNAEGTEGEKTEAKILTSDTPETTTEDVLVLDESDVVEGEGAHTQEEEKIDLDTFAKTGEISVGDVNAKETAEVDMMDEVVGEKANPPVPKDMPAETEGDAEVVNPTPEPEEVDVEALVANGASEDAKEEDKADSAEKADGSEGADTPADTPDSDALAKADVPADDAEVDVDALMAGSAEEKAEESSEEADSAPKEAENAKPAEEDSKKEGADDAEVDVDALMAGGDDASAKKDEKSDEKPDEKLGANEKPESNAKENSEAVKSDSENSSKAEENSEKTKKADASPSDTEKGTQKAPPVQKEDSKGTETDSKEANQPENDAKTPSNPSETMLLPSENTPEGLQVAFPTEVLAAALRPLVKDWVEVNLQGIVERLVKEELERLAKS